MSNGAMNVRHYGQTIDFREVGDVSRILPPSDLAKEFSRVSAMEVSETLREARDAAATSVGKPDGKCGDDQDIHIHCTGGKKEKPARSAHAGARFPS